MYTGSSTTTNHTETIMALKNLHRCFFFHHEDFGFYAEKDYGDIEWDKDGDEPTEAEIEAAYNWWHNEGWNEALGSEADDEADYRYEMSREDY
jgi:hypothetical protein